MSLAIWKSLLAQWNGVNIVHYEIHHTGCQGRMGSHPKPIAALTGKLASTAWDYSSLPRPWCHNSEAAACLGGCRKLCRFSLCVLQGSSGQVSVWWLLWKNISPPFWGSSWPTTTIPRMRNSDQVSTNVSNFGGIDKKKKTTGVAGMFLRIKMSSWSPKLLNKRNPEVGLYSYVFQTWALGNSDVGRGNHVANRLPNSPCFIWHP